MKTRIGILTGGGDCPGLNAVIRAVVKSAAKRGWETLGIYGGFEGLLRPTNTKVLDYTQMDGLLYTGGTILGTSNKGRFSAKAGHGESRAIDPAILAEARAGFEELGLRALVVVGGDGSLSIAQQCLEAGIPVVGVPKTIDNDIEGTVVTFGFDSAVAFATDALDRLRSTAQSHDRVMVGEVMGRYAGWIAAHAGIAGGADAILIPEFPYEVKKIAKAIRRRSEHGMNFSIVAVAEGALSRQYADRFKRIKARLARARSPEAQKAVKQELADLDRQHSGNTLRLAAQLERLTGLESRVTILGYVQRGGAPSAVDRLLATRLGSACVEFLREGVFGVMVAARGDGAQAVPLKEVAGKRKEVTQKHPWVEAARAVGTCLGD